MRHFNQTGIPKIDRWRQCRIFPFLPWRPLARPPHSPQRNRCQRGRTRITNPFFLASFSSSGKSPRTADSTIVHIKCKILLKNVVILILVFTPHKEKQREYYVFLFSSPGYERRRRCLASC